MLQKKSAAPGDSDYGKQQKYRTGFAPGIKQQTGDEQNRIVELRRYKHIDEKHQRQKYIQKSKTRKNHQNLIVSSGCRIIWNTVRKTP